MSKPDWKETPINNDWDKEYYTARVHCTNNCGYMGERIIQIRKGVKRSEIQDVKCDHCGCPAKA